MQSLISDKYVLIYLLITGVLKDLFSEFNFLSFQHPYQELNSEADAFSKEALKLDKGLLHFEENLENRVVSSVTISMY